MARAKNKSRAWASPGSRLPRYAQPMARQKFSTLSPSEASRNQVATEKPLPPLCFLRAFAAERPAVNHPEFPRGSTSEAYRYISPRGCDWWHPTAPLKVHAICKNVHDYTQRTLLGPPVERLE